jgi:hypothetical protein
VPFILFQNDEASYHGKIVKTFVKGSLPPSGPSVTELKVVRPVVNSVSFHRYGKEFAITITGDNLWFCNEVKVDSLKQVIKADDTTQRSLQFNVEDGKDLGTADHVSVKAWSQFASPVTNPKAEVKHKVSKTI